jgi:putative ABC transport system permease protein
MREALTQALDNLRANKLRSVLTMFGILWGIIAVVVLAATGEGFQRGNQAVLEELGKNIAIVWGGRTTMQAGGERAGRRVFLTVEDARALAREAPLVAVVSAEINRGLRIKSRFNAASLSVHGIEPQYQAIRTLDIEHGRSFVAADDEQVRRVAIIGADAWAQLFGTREGLHEVVELNGVPYTVIGKIR